MFDAQGPPVDQARSVLPSRRWRRALAVVCTAWLVFIVIMLLRSTVPNLGRSFRLGNDAIGHLGLSAMMGFAIAATLTMADRRPVPSSAWYATIATAVLVLALELAQIPVPVRSFQADDLVYGIVGGLIGVAMAAGCVTVMGPRLLVRLMTVCGSLALVFSIAVAVVRDPSRLAAAIDVPATTIGSTATTGE